MTDKTTTSTTATKYPHLKSTQLQQKTKPKQQQLKQKKQNKVDPIKLRKPLRALFIGPSGCGKTLQAERVREAISAAGSSQHRNNDNTNINNDISIWSPIVHINLRHILHKLKDQDLSEIGDYLREFWRTSHITSNVADVSLKIVSDELDRIRHKFPDSEPSFIIEGAPQTLTEASKLEALLDSKSMQLNCVIKFDISEEAIHNRLQSGNAAKQITRPDTDSKAAQHRRRNLASVAKYYQDRNILYSIESDQNPDQVFSRLKRVICEIRYQHEMQRPRVSPEPVKHIGEYLPAYSSETIMVKRRMKAYSGSQFDKFPGSHSVSLHRNVLEDMQHRADEYVYSIKANGMRFFLLLTERNAYFINRKLEVYRCTHLFPNEIFTNQEHECLFDGEIVAESAEENDQELRVLYVVFDVLYSSGKNVKRLPLFQRLKHADICLVTPFHTFRNLTMQYSFPFTSHYLQRFLFYPVRPNVPVRFNVCLQHYYKFNEIEDVLNRFIQNRRYPTDGLVFAHMFRQYKLGLDNYTRKWKPLHQNTIDFALKLETGSLVRSEQKTSESVQEHTLQVLDDNGHLINYCKINLTNDQSMYLASGMIVECWWSPSSLEDVHHIGEKVGTGPGEWKLIRVRHDKDTPNPEWLVQRIWTSIRDALTQQELLQTLKFAVQDKPFLVVPGRVRGASGSSSSSPTSSWSPALSSSSQPEDNDGEVNGTKPNQQDRSAGGLRGGSRNEGSSNQKENHGVEYSGVANNDSMGLDPHEPLENIVKVVYKKNNSRKRRSKKHRTQKTNGTQEKQDDKSNGKHAETSTSGCEEFKAVSPPPATKAH